jgi:hypothetical protein
MEPMKFIISDLPVLKGDLTVFIDLIDATKDKDEPCSERLMQVTTENPDPGEKNNRYLSWIGKDSFESVFFYRDNTSEVLDLFVLIEKNTPVLLKRIEVFNHPDVMVREFENGLVLANPSSNPYSLDMEDLFPGQSFRRLRGTTEQDTITNDGSEIHKILDLPGKDALFLIRQGPVQSY